MKTNGHENVYNFELTGHEASVLSMTLLNYVRKDCPEPKGIQQELLEIVRRLDALFVFGGEKPDLS